MLWTSDELTGSWNPPACAGWQNRAETKVVGLAGQFRSNPNEMLARIGAISSLKDVRYWSVTEKRWNALFARANALNGPDMRRARGDFSTAEIGSGGDFYFVAADNRSRDDTVWRLHVSAMQDGNIRLQTSNVTPIHWYFVKLIAPGDLQTSYFVDNDGSGTWRIYTLTRVLYVSPVFAWFAPAGSYINRAVALYRHYAGIPTDRDPPAIR